MMLLPRVLTAIVGIPLVLLAIYWGGIPYFILMSGITLFCLNEFFILSSKAGYTSTINKISGIILGYLIYLSVFLSSTSFSARVNHQLVAVVLTLILAIFNFVEIIQGGEISGAMGRIGVSFYGVFLLPWSIAHLSRLYYLKPYGREWVFLLFITIWALDTAAYFIGVKFGSRRLAPTVSPAKSWEGLLAGALTAMIVVPLLGKILMKNYISIKEGIILGIILTLVGQFSDLAESLIKRDADIKDSDELLPGHGGMLDRFDAFLFTSPLLYYYIILFK